MHLVLQEDKKQTFLPESTNINKSVKLENCVNHDQQ